MSGRACETKQRAFSQLCSFPNFLSRDSSEMRNSPNFNHHQTSTNITKNSNSNNDTNQHFIDNNQYQTAPILTIPSTNITKNSNSNNDTNQHLHRQQSIPNSTNTHHSGKSGEYGNAGNLRNRGIRGIRGILGVEEDSGESGKSRESRRNFCIPIVPTCLLSCSATKMPPSGASATSRGG